MGELRWIYDCGTFLAATGMPLALALFVAGLGGSVTHCSTMCSTFVLGQSAALQGGSVLTQLLLPYHVGRMATYSALGATGGFAFSFVAASPVFAVIRHLSMALAPVVFLAVFAERLLARLQLRRFRCRRQAAWTSPRMPRILSIAASS